MEIESLLSRLDRVASTLEASGHAHAACELDTITNSLEHLAASTLPTNTDQDK